MKKALITYGAAACILMGAAASHAEKWEKNEYKDQSIRYGYYDAESVKTKGSLVSWTERYILTPEGIAFVNAQLEKHPACKEKVAKEGKVTEYQLDYEIKNGKMFRGVAKRYYNRSNKVVCTDKETGADFKNDWHTIHRGSPIEQAQYDLVTRYKVKFQ